MLGFHPDKHPGKVTGLAAYSEPPEELVDRARRVVSGAVQPRREGELVLPHPHAGRGGQLERLRELRQTRFGGWTREEISSAIQHILERDVLALSPPRPGPGGPQHRPGGWRLRERKAEPARQGDGLQADLRPARDGRRRHGPRRRDPGRPPARRRFARTGSRRVSRARHSRTPRSRAALERAGLRSRSSAAGGLEARLARAAPRRLHHRPLPGPHGVRPARARQPLDPLPRQGPGGERLAEQAAEALGVHAVRADDAGRAADAATTGSRAPSTPRSS